MIREGFCKCETELPLLAITSVMSSTVVAAPTWNKTIAAVGDLAILWRGHKDVSYQHLTPDGSFHHAVGRFNHNDIIGKPYGTRLVASVAQKHGRSQQARQCCVSDAASLGARSGVQRTPDCVLPTGWLRSRTL